MAVQRANMAQDFLLADRYAITSMKVCQHGRTLDSPEAVA